jgi:peptidoglycan/xylan/chitin deacetylase (PgdA/CDA1 family)
VAGPAPTLGVALGALGGLAFGAGVLHGFPALSVLGALAPWSPPSLGPWCRWRVPPEVAGERVALTFDDGPDRRTTPRVLAVLDGLGLQATFFVLGAALARSGALAAELVAAGHELGVHGFHHEHHLLRRPRWVLEDLRRAVGVVEEATGQTPRWFRPPYGQLAAGSLRAAGALGLEVVLWSVWGKEFADPEPERIRRRLAAGLRPGAVVLLHDSDLAAPAGTGARTAALLPGLAEDLAVRGLRADRLDRVAA